jgi:hypothetical protein
VAKTTPEAGQTAGCIVVGTVVVVVGTVVVVVGGTVVVVVGGTVVVVVGGTVVVSLEESPSHAPISASGTTRLRYVRMRDMTHSFPASS